MIFSLQQKAECAQREWRFRKRVYPRWVAAGKMTQAEADREIALMEAIVRDYREKTDLFGA